jgi:predicted deacylase
MGKMVIDGTEIRPGEVAQINALIGRLPTRTPLNIPIFVSRAKEEGPTLLLMAGMHGDEINGIEIVRRAIKSNLYHPARGTVIAIPVFNVYGFINQSRGLPDGKDLNRAFPGVANGSLASRVAYFFSTQILPQIDFGIDFHTGGASRNNFPQLRGMFENEMEVKIGKAFGAPFMINSPHRERSLRKTASRQGRYILVYEGGQTLRLRKQVIDQGIIGIHGVMHHFNMIDEPPAGGTESIHLTKSQWVRARHSGMHHANVRNGTRVNKGEVVGVITDPYGQFEKKIKAPVTGYVIGLNNYPVVNMGDALLHIGQE